VISDSVYIYLLQVTPTVIQNHTVYMNVDANFVRTYPKAVLASDSSNASLSVISESVNEILHFRF
jgi:hypothetical protein